MTRQDRKSEASSPDLEEGVPAARAERHAVGTDAETRDAVVVRVEHVHQLALDRVPHDALEVVVAAEQVAARNRERDRCDPAVEVVVLVECHALVGANVEQATRRVVGTRGESISIRKV